MTCLALGSVHVHRGQQLSQGNPHIIVSCCHDHSTPRLQATSVEVRVVQQLLCGCLC